MGTSQIYILISIVVLLIIFILLFFTTKNNKNKKQKILTPLASIAFAFVLGGTLFGDNKWLTYSLIGIGVLLAVIDMFIKLNKK